VNLFGKEYQTMKTNKKFLLFLIGIVGVTLTACGTFGDPRELADEPYEAQEFLLGTLANIKVYDEGKEDALNDALARVEELDGMFSMTDSNSEIYAINQAAGQEPVEVSDEVFYVIEQALDYAEESNGLFDPTVGVITDLWGIGQDDARVPSQEEIEEKLPLVDYEKVQLDEEGQTVYLEEEGMMLDLGAIAKGYITDEAARTLVNQGVTTSIVDLGGDIYVIGSSHRAIDDDWRVGIQNPFDERGEIVGIVPVKNESVVTSGIYERYVEDDEGNQYHHIINPQTGYPVNNEIAGLSLVAENSLRGDALSTAVFEMGVEEGLEFVNSKEDIEAVFITKDQEIYLSEGYAEEFELTNEDFELVNN